MNNKLKQVLEVAIQQQEKHSYDPHIAKLFVPIIDTINEQLNEK
jgi:response regulator RpfG family c-di-GMP phosphodiesterase